MNKILSFTNVCFMGYIVYNVYNEVDVLSKNELKIIKEYINTQHLLKQTIERIPKLTNTIEGLLEDMKIISTKTEENVEKIIKNHTEKLIILQKEIEDYKKEFHNDRWYILQSNEMEDPITVLEHE
jgi:hypothetical protein